MPKSGVLCNRSAPGRLSVEPIGKFQGSRRPRESEVQRRKPAFANTLAPVGKPMPPACSPDELFGYLDSLGIAHQTVTHPPMFKVEDGRTLRDRVAGGHTKNLFLRDKKGVVFLVVAPAQAAIELKSLHRPPGGSGRFSFGSAELMRETPGVEPGSVTPFAAINDKSCGGTVFPDAAILGR